MPAATVPAPVAAAPSAPAPATSGTVLLAGSVAHSMTGRSKETAQFDGVEAAGLSSFHVYAPLAGVPVVALGAGCTAVHYAAVAADGGLHVWGRNEKGQLGTGDTRNVYRALAVKGVPPMAAVAVGRAHTLALTRAGAVWSAGAGLLGQLGNGKIVDSQPTFRPAGNGLPADDPVTGVAAGGEFSVAVTRAGRVFACGSAQCGQLGNGTTGERIVSAGRLGYDTEAAWLPVAFPAGSLPVVQVAAGACCAARVGWRGQGRDDGQGVEWASHRVLSAHPPTPPLLPFPSLPAHRRRGALGGAGRGGLRVDVGDGRVRPPGPRGARG